MSDQETIKLHNHNAAGHGVTVRCVNGERVVIEPGESAVFEYDTKSGRFVRVLEHTKRP